VHDESIEPVLAPEPRASRVTAVVFGSVIVIVGLLLELIVVGVAIGFAETEGGQHTSHAAASAPRTRSTTVSTID